MAKKIEELIVELGIKGLEGLDNLSSSFRNLQKAIGPSDNAITQVRKSILDMSSAGKQSIQMIQGQIDAFKGLQTQATIGSNVYKQLAGDVNRLSDTLKKLKGDYEEVGRVARQTDAQIANQFPARKPEAFRVQIAALNRELSKLSVSARAYGDALTEITIRETAFGRAQARQGVIAGAQAVGSPRIAQALPTQELPNTLAALQQRINELRQDFQNLDRTSSDYLPTLREINTLTREYTNATVDGNAARKNEIRDRIASLQAINAENGALRAQDAIEKSIARNARKVARRQGPAPIEQPMRPISALYQSISDVGMAKIGREIEMMGNSYEQVAIDINAATKASNGSIASLQAQRSAWQQLRTQLDPASAGFKKTGREIELLDRRLEKLQVRQRRGLGPMGATQAAGAVISGGIFGGPEGAIGGAIGTAVGGVPGAFAGAAIGAQVGIMRQSLGTMASFTAEIDKQRIALRNVVGSQEQYNSSLQFIDQASRRLAIPQDQLNKQFTQLSASVIGAGGNVDAAKIAFNGIAAGIRGTGGSLADMQSAMLATSQVFSKGKVSAEELRQQIGERLPGAFTLFAQSIGKTPQELDKMLEKGEVGLNDFMTFVQALSQRYGSSAAEIAASSQAAGDRMQVTFARLREAIGRELQPIGAQFQEIFANFFEENEQAIVNFAKSLAGAMKVFADNAGLIAGVLKTLLGFGAIAGTAVVFAQVAAGVATLSAAIVQLGGVAGVASLAMQALSVSMAAIPVIGWIGAAVAGLALLGKAVYDTNDTFRNFVDNIGGVIANDFQYAVTGMVKDAQASTGQIQAAFDGLSRYFESVGSFIRELFTGVFGSVSQSGDSSARQLDSSFGTAFSNILSQGAAAFGGLSAMIGNWFNSLPAPIRSILGGNTAALLVGAAGAAGSAASRASQGKPERQGPPVPARLTVAGPSVPSFPGFPSGTTPGGGSTGGAAKAPKQLPESRIIQLRAELEAIVAIGKAEDQIRDLRFAGLDDSVIAAEKTKTLADIERDRVKALQQANYTEERLIINKIAEARVLDATLKSEDQLRDLLQKRFEDGLGYEKTVRDTVQPFKDLIREQELQVQHSKTVSRLLAEGILPAEAERLANFDKMVTVQTRSLEIDIELTRSAIERAKALGLSTADMEKQLALAEARLEGVQGAAAAGPGQGPTTVDRLRETTNAVGGELNTLMDPVNQIVGAANAIGDSFGNAFKGVISGSMSAKEALAGFFQSVADHFLDMAAQMIAAWIKMAILNTVVKIFGAGFSGGFGGDNSFSSFDAGGAQAFSAPALSSGAAFAGGGATNYSGQLGGIAFNPAAFAKGGFVTGPTSAVIGEGGESEYVIPASKMQSAMSRYSRGARGQGVIAGSGGGSEGGGGAAAAGPMVVDVRYSVERINDVEYVTASQFQAGMRQAAQQGAAQGEQRTLRRLQQSPGARKRVGI